MLTVFCKYRKLEVIRPIVWPAIAAAVVSRIAGCCISRSPFSAIVSYIALMILLIAIYKILLLRERRLYRLIIVLIVLQSLRVLPQLLPIPVQLDRVTLRVRPVCGMPAETSAGVRKIFVDPFGRRYLVSLPPELRYVTSFRYSGKVEAPQGPRNPGGFDEAHYVRSFGAVGQFTIRSGAVSDEDILSRNRYVMPTIDRIRERLIRNWEERYGVDEANLFRALALGDKRKLTAEENARLQGSGLAHLAAVSGTHIGLLLLPIQRLATRPKMKNRGLEYLFLPILILYIMLCHFSIGILRAFLGFYFRVMAKGRHQTVDSFHITAKSALVLLLFDPLVANRTDFLLSFGAALALAYTFDLDRSIERFRKCNTSDGDVLETFTGHPVHRLENTLQQVTKGLQIQFVLAIPLMYLSNQINFMSIFATIPAVAITGALLAGLAVAPLTGTFGVTVQRVLLHFFLKLNALTHEIRFLKLFNRPADWLCLTAAGITILLYKQRYLLASLIPQSDRVRQGLTALLMTIIVVSRIFASATSPAVWFLDVGHGDAILIISNTGTTCLIDGGDVDHGYRTVRPALQALGIDRIDCAVITHAHSDHYAGVIELAHLGLVDTVNLSESMAHEHVPVNREGGASEKTVVNEALLAVSWQDYLTRFADVYSVKAGDSIVIDGLDTPLEVLHPTHEYASSDLNDMSLVLRFTHRETTFLLTGDSTKKILSQPHIWEKSGKYAILKVAHHGSAGSHTRDEIARFEPSLSVVSCPIRSRHHPAANVVSELDELGPVLRTDRNGAVCVDWSDTIRIGSMR